MKCCTKSPKIIKRIISEIFRFIIFFKDIYSVFGVFLVQMMENEGIRTLFIQLCQISLYFRLGLFISNLKNI